MKTETLGPELCEGQKLQICVEGGFLKWNQMVRDVGNDEYEYSLIGEAVAPGKEIRCFNTAWKESFDALIHIHCFHTRFDFHNFCWVPENELYHHCTDSNVFNTIKQYLQKNDTEMKADKMTVEMTTEYYEENDLQKTRAAELVKNHELMNSQ